MENIRTSSQVECTSITSRKTPLTRLLSLPPGNLVLIPDSRMLLRAILLELMGEGIRGAHSVLREPR